MPSLLLSPAAPPQAPAHLRRLRARLGDGGSTTLVCGGALRNVSRVMHGITLPGGRAISTAPVFHPA